MSSQKKIQDKLKQKRARETCYEFVARRKLAIGRCECGNCDHIVTISNLRHFEFDHIDPATKVDTIASFCRRGQLQKLIVELTKCRLLHVTCHRDHSEVQADLGYGFPPLQLEWDLFTPPYDLPSIQRQVEEEEKEPYASFSVFCWRMEGDFAVLRDHNLRLQSCIRISTGKHYRWHPDFGFYEHTDHQSVLRARMNNH